MLIINGVRENYHGTPNSLPVVLARIRRQCDNLPLIIDISGKIAVKTAQPSLNVL